MPILQSQYKPSFLFRNAHFSTIYPNVLRKVNGVEQTRERISLDDGDFIDLDWSYATSRSEKLTIIIHGLEGNGQRQYILGLAKQLNKNGWDAVAVNLRSCSGENNLLYKSYYAGATEDLDEIITHIVSRYEYKTICLSGFSLGGNIILKFLGENHSNSMYIKKAVTVSVPCDLHNSLKQLNKSNNFIYRKRFIKHLKEKLNKRQRLFPDRLSVSEIKACRSLMDIDDLYTSKAHGFKTAIDYYTKCSSKQFLKKIKIPTLVINAKNDSFLGDKCYPVREAEENSNLYLEIPDYGGHVGFYEKGEVYYNERRTIDFFEE